jgi:hypothetical protein
MFGKVALGTLVAFVLLMLLGYLVYDVLLADTMTSMMSAAGDCITKEMNMIYISLAILFQAVLLASLLYRLNANTFSRGFATAAWITLLIVLWYGMWFLTSYPWYTMSLLGFDLLITTLLAAVVGGVLGVLYGRRPRKQVVVM